MKLRDSLSSHKTEREMELTREGFWPVLLMTIAFGCYSGWDEEDDDEEAVEIGWMSGNDFFHDDDNDFGNSRQLNRVWW